ncbi:hypothetical protein, partial [Enterobacter roggenkampii]|uniref:hypothetical protein n=1 Tax=Enterobacter roggenkampii TaxID=1812935 RepID=UPI0022E8CAF8
ALSEHKTLSVSWSHYPFLRRLRTKSTDLLTSSRVPEIAAIEAGSAIEKSLMKNQSDQIITLPLDAKNDYQR